MSIALLGKAVFTGLVMLTASVAQGAVIDGTIYRTGGLAAGSNAPWYYGGPDVETTVDRHYFTVNSASVVTFDILSWEGSVDFSAGSPPTDVNGDSEIAFLDTMIRLYNADTNAFIDVSDDSGTTFGDGSIFDRDSFLSLALGIGNYFLAVGTWDLTDAEVFTGPGSGSGPMTWNGSTYVVNDHGDYRLSITGDVSVPEPSTLAVIGMALLSLFGFGMMRRRADA